MTIRLSTTMRNAIADAIAGMMGYATLKIYTGTQPASGDTAATGTLLVDITLAGFNPSASGSATLNTSMPVQGTAVASGTTGWARLTDGTNNFDGSVGTSATDFIINTTAITTGGTVTLTGCTINQPAS
jgi:hypothetical protein